MKELEVSSRIIRSVYYSQEDGGLRICFKNGEERLFTGVTEEAATALVDAPSPGQHYIDYIRHQFKRVAY
ncbi:KTSC domain-containing protein [Rhizobium sp. Root1220]|uniref:KTSC domain-containing protein n=1 Tax=Rhizobium sp. Root1220 TaxID=1736432 RepID=UPI0006F5AA70|nr:KTSC domain-containing protein [Rhizobium sp. Root1220]KQV84447.1 hypothetical protein ASC90_02760 [Rhizobium sp. Root1220]